MRYNFLILIVLILVFQKTPAQNFPAFGPEKNVTVTGLNFDAMELFISPDGNTLFFNSINSGGNTNLYYASKIDDTTFTYEGLIGGCYDPSPNHLDAVASMDSLNNFFWISVRNYPTVFENLHRGKYSTGNVSSITRVYGDFNIFTPGWLIMDGTINYQGNLLYYNNAYFNNCTYGMPCKARLGVAQKVNDSTFNKLSNTEAIFANVNDTNYLVYAPQITKDGFELYFTRILNTTVNSEICVSVRNSLSDPFSLPFVIHSNNGFVPEAPTLTTDKQRLYYHQKNGSGVFKINMRYRTSATGINKIFSPEDLKLFPNPTTNSINITVPNPNEKYEIEIHSPQGQLILKTSTSRTIDIEHLPKGIYFLTVNQNNKIVTKKIVKQ